MSHGFEAQLLRWSETSNGGATIVLQLSDPADLDAFKRMTLAKKGMVGQRLMVGVAEIGDDELPVSQESQLSQQGPKGGPLARLAGIWCGEIGFQHWLFDRFNRDGTLILGKENEQTADLLRLLCGINSRAELDTNEDARECFDRKIRIPYSQFLKENH